MGDPLSADTGLALPVVFFTGNSKVVRCACYIFYKGEEVAVNFWDIFYSVLSYH